MTGRKFWTFGLVLVLCVIATAGCKKRRSSKTTINQGGADIFTTDSYPGTDVQSGNVADDKRAFSPSGQNYTGSLICTANGDRGQCMVTYVTDGNQVYAQYYNGTWTPPVALRAVDAVTSTMTGNAFNIVHAFINTSEHVSENAQARDGDCIIVWRADDTDDDGGGSDGINTCVFTTYFDATYAGDVANNYGFQEFGTRINSEDSAGESASATVGLVTDGLCGEARWSSQGHSYSYGDQTTSIIVVWYNVDFDDAVTGDGHLRAVRFDPAEAILEDLPLTPGGDTQMPINALSASDSGLTSATTMVMAELISYNNTLFFKVKADADVPWSTAPQEQFSNFGNVAPASDGCDITIQYYNFDLETTTYTGPVVLSPGTNNAGTLDTAESDSEFLKLENGAAAVLANTFLAGPTSTFGSDEGLGVIVHFSVHLVDDADMAAGGIGQDVLVDTDVDARLRITQIWEDAGTVAEAGFVNFSDSDLFAGNNDGVDEGDVLPQISRNGDYIWLAWLQRVDSGLTDEVGLRVCQYQTTRLLDDGSFPTSIMSLADSLSADFIASPDSDGETVHWFMYQDMLGYVCGVQSDPDVMNIFYEQSRDDGTDLIDEVFFSRLTADVYGGPTVAVVTAGATYEVFEAGDQPGSGQINTELFNFNATDSGEGGNIFAVYRDDVDGTATDDFRLFAEATGLNGGIEEIDSEVTFRQVPGQGLTLVATPLGSEIGQYDLVDLEDSDARPHAAQQVHVIFREDESTEDSGLGDALRTRVWDTDVDAAVVFGDRFVPNATTGVTFEFPFDLDLPFVDPNSADEATNVNIAVCDNTVGVWFVEMRHVYYQEYTGSANGDELGWLNDGGESNPFLVDDDNDEEIASFIDFCTYSCTCCDLNGAVVFWTKQYGSGGGQSTRLQVRVRDGGN